MNRLKFIMIICVCIIVAAIFYVKNTEINGNTKAVAKKAVLDVLKDPDSAKFGKFTQVNAGSVCLTVNARNSYGGYTGDQQAIVVQFGKDWRVLGIENISHETCIEIMKVESAEIKDKNSDSAKIEDKKSVPAKIKDKKNVSAKNKDNNLSFKVENNIPEWIDDVVVGDGTGGEVYLPPDIDE